MEVLWRFFSSRIRGFRPHLCGSGDLALNESLVAGVEKLLLVRLHVGELASLGVLLGERREMGKGDRGVAERNDRIWVEVEMMGSLLG